MEKLSKTAKKLDVFFKILLWILIAAVGIFVLIAVIASIWLAAGGRSGEAVNEQFILGNIRLNISKEAMPAVSGAWWIYLLACLAFVIAAAAAIWGIRIIRSILKPMAAGSPFIGSVSADLKKLGYLALFGGAVIEFCKIIGDILLFKLFYDVSGSIFSDAVTGVTYTQSFDLTFVIVAAILFLVSYAFRYGEELQKQADETL